ncbi:protein lin-11-like [Venturia canescens]|uniref:protein lin-11-like n=1 Tax=Venturia canescens TaxID=32260 RepID=UPI001C9D3B56|nr:protein lin-11-like [Venturia canescens]
MNPHHPGHPAAYPHHSSLSSSPHHSGPGGGHHGSYTGGGSTGGGNTTTPDLPSPHSPPTHGGQAEPGTLYGSLSSGPGLGSNGNHHGAVGMMSDHTHHSGHIHPHLQSHPAYPVVNHNNNCTLKQEGGPSVQSSGQNCAGCGGRIVERWLLHALDRYWHNSCLKCSYCGAALADMGTSCYAKSGLILCKHDYVRMFGGACSGCGQLIPANELVTRAGGTVFHVKCFRCSKCAGELVSGDKYFLVGGSPVCEADYLKIAKSSGATATSTAASAAGNGGAPVRKGKVGRPRRSRE